MTHPMAGIHEPLRHAEVLECLGAVEVSTWVGDGFLNDIWNRQFMAVL